MAWTYKYADGSTGSTPWSVGADGQYNVQDEGVVQYGVPGSTGGGGATAMSVMGYAPTDGTFVDPASVRPSGGATFGGGGGGAGGGGMVRDNSYGGGMATGGASTAGQNPYLKQMGDVMTGQMTDNFNRKVMPSIASGAMASGGFGGSRQGVVEANAMNDLNGQIGGALTNLYGQGFNTALNYDLGLRGNDLGFAGLDAQINQNNFNNNMAGANFGLGVWNQGMANNQTGINAGTNIQNTPMNYNSQFGNQYNSIGRGFGSTTGSTSQQGSPMLGALGGAQLGSRIANMWGGGPTTNSPGGANAQGWGTGAGYGNQDLGQNF